MLDGPQGPAGCRHLPKFTFSSYNYFSFQYVALPVKKKQTEILKQNKKPIYNPVK